MRAIFSEEKTHFKEVTKPKQSAAITSGKSDVKTEKIDSEKLEAKVERIQILTSDFKIHNVSCTFTDDELKIKYETLEKITAPEEWLHDNENPEDIESLAYKSLQRVLYFDPRICIFIANG